MLMVINSSRLMGGSSVVNGPFTGADLAMVDPDRWIAQSQDSNLLLATANAERV